MQKCTQTSDRKVCWWWVYLGVFCLFGFFFPRSYFLLKDPHKHLWFSVVTLLGEQSKAWCSDVFILVLRLTAVSKEMNAIDKRVLSFENRGLAGDGSLYLLTLALIVFRIVLTVNMYSWHHLAAAAVVCFIAVFLSLLLPGPRHLALCLSASLLI